MRRTLYPLLTLLSLAPIACTPATRPTLLRSDLIDDVESAHGKDAWRSRQVFQTDITVDFADRRAVDGTLTFTTDGRKARIDTRDGRRLVYDGQHAWSAPSDKPATRARFTLLTWPYFIAAPFKLRDAGTHTVDLGEERVNGILYKTVRLTFDPGTGDSSDDWFRLYVDDDTRRLGAMAYIVTYGRKLTDPDPKPHAIVYDDFTTVNGVTLATTWYFRDWTEERGFLPTINGTGHLSNMKFVTPPPGFFDKPADAVEDPRPSAG